jgi:hypothetical protein
MGQFVATAVTDATGSASITFTAMQIGTTYCWLTAAAGAKVVFDVIVYPPSSAYVSATLDPAEPRPGQAFKVVAAAQVGHYPIFNADLTARIVPRTTSATLSDTAVNTGTSGTASFSVTPDRTLGDYDVEVSYRDRVSRIAMRAPANPWQDLWWSGTAENGWGMSIVQHRDTLFANVYAYDAAGKPVWYVMPNGDWNAAHTAFTGPLFLPHGTPFTAYDASRFDGGAPVGTMTLTFDNLANSARMDYTIDGVAGTKAIERIAFGEGGTSPTTDVGDLWWGGVAQNGWGIAALQSGRTLFSLWFTYDENGNATWFSMPGGYWRDASNYTGSLYRSTGSSWVGRPYDLSAFRMSEIGGYTLRFNADGTATFLYSFLDGRGGTLPLTRIPF